MDSNNNQPGELSTKKVVYIDMLVSGVWVLLTVCLIGLHSEASKILLMDTTINTVFEERNKLNLNELTRERVKDVFLNCISFIKMSLLMSTLVMCMYICATWTLNKCIFSADTDRRKALKLANRWINMNQFMLPIFLMILAALVGVLILVWSGTWEYDLVVPILPHLLKGNLVLLVVFTVFIFLRVYLLYVVWRYANELQGRQPQQRQRRRR